ncbi:hypothetical protein HJFPF1_08308 [Paramyrothecium foliicola]|nr:hypothetical protein HJFPF1_08308 [Paramyrothecium foliicola]
MDTSSRATRKAQLLRQLQNRRLQANTADCEIEQIDPQIAAQRCRIVVTENDRLCNAITLGTLPWSRNDIKTKYGINELYAWVENSLQDLNHRAYTIAFDLATKAEMASTFERGTIPIARYSLSPPDTGKAREMGFLAPKASHLD